MKMSVHNSPIETINENNLIKTHECIPQTLTSLYVLQRLTTNTTLTRLYNVS